MPDTDWIKPGAEIVVYSRGYSGDSHPRRTTVKTRATRSFTVEGIPDRFRLDTMETKTTGTWTSARSWVAIAPDSVKAVAMFEAQRKQSLVFGAQVAMDKWERDRTRENRLAAIAALQAVEDDEVAS